MTNLVIIDCHDIGKHLGAYGWETVPSKNLDALADRGVNFTNSFCTAPQCSPSRAGLYTGRYPHANGMLGLAHHPFNWRLHPEETHLATYLRDAGYATTLIGVQHVTGHEPRLIQALGFDDIQQIESAQEVGQTAAEFLSNLPPEPFFLKIGFLDPHRDADGHFKQAPPDSSLGVKLPPYLPKTKEAYQEMAQLQGVIRQMDEAVGCIWKAISESGLLKNTWVIFTTDHGIAMPHAKCTLYDPGIEISLIMFSEPFGLTGGLVFNELVSNVDLVPTILEMLNIHLPEHLQGQSFANLLRKQPHTPRTEIFAEKTFHTAYEPQRAIRTNRYKLIWNVEAGIINVPGDIMHSPIFPQMINTITQERPHFELYDLSQDQQELNNLASNPDYAEVFHNLCHKLVDWMQKTDDPILKGPLASSFYYQGLEKLTESNL